MADWRAAMAAKGHDTGPAPASNSVAKVKVKMGLDYFMQRMYSSEDIKGRVISIYSEEGMGKTVLSAKLGKSNLFIADDNGILSFQNHPELDAISIAIPFEGYDRAVEVLELCEAGKLINPKTDTPFDNVVFDTVSGMCSTEIRRSIDDGDIPTEKGKLADNIPTRPHYLLSEQNFGPLMKQIGNVKNFSVTLLLHLRTGVKDVPGASTRADMHGAAYKLMAKYSSVVGYLHLKDGNRVVRVMPGELTAAKSRYNFGKSVLTDDEFVSKIEEWKRSNS